LSELARGRCWQRIHLHKFRAGNYFRVHAALHVTGVDDESPWLNGLSSHDGWFKGRWPWSRRYRFHFDDSPEGLAACAGELTSYIRDHVVPWFDAWSDEARLAGAPDSPLTPEGKEFLQRVLREPRASVT
jgi:hypothetical protein